MRPTVDPAGRRPMFRIKDFRKRRPDPIAPSSAATGEKSGSLTQP